MDYAPSVGRVRAVKSPSFTAAFFAKEAVRKRRPRHSIRMDGGPAQPSLTIGQCLNGGLGWLEVECNRCKTPRDTPLWKMEASLKCRSCRKGRYAPPVHLIKVTQMREITPHKWVHPDEEGSLWRRGLRGPDGRHQRRNARAD